MPFPPNSDYGAGAARRIIQLDKPTEAIVDARLVDNYHEMRLRLNHDGIFVKDIEGELIRFPTTACPGSTGMIKELVGTRLDTELRLLYEQTRLQRNCTHLFDLAAFAIRHARRPALSRTYEAVVPDAIDTAVTIEVRCNAVTIHSWQICDGHILSPAALAGQPLLKGFAKWSAALFDGDALEAATLLSKTCFIATVRPFAPETSVGKSVLENLALAGACFAYAPERIAETRYSEHVGEVPHKRDRRQPSAPL